VRVTSNNTLIPANEKPVKYEMKIPSSPVTTLLFDMDNTLFDLVGAQETSCDEVCRHFGRNDGKDLFEYFLRPVRGFESHENILDYLADRSIPPDGQYEKACRIYESVKLQSITPYDGVPETLGHLSDRGYRMAIVTDAHSRDATLRLGKIGLLPFFDCMISYDMTGRKKPAPDAFLLALEVMKAKACETVVIGDSPRRDIEPCHGLGIRTVYARYGDRFSDDRSDVPADYTIDSMRELPGILGMIG
jgi:putative hydrolase of the HAD superfamily